MASGIEEGIKEGLCGFYLYYKQQDQII